MRAAQDSVQRVTREQDAVASGTHFHVAQSSLSHLEELDSTRAIENRYVTVELPGKEVSTAGGHRTTQEMTTRAPGDIANWASASEPLPPLSLTEERAGGPGTAAFGTEMTETTSLHGPASLRCHTNRTKHTLCCCCCCCYCCCCCCCLITSGLIASFFQQKVSLSAPPCLLLR